MPDFEHFNINPPEDLVPPVENPVETPAAGTPPVETPPTETPPTGETPPGGEPGAQDTPPIGEQPKPTEEPKPDEFIENLNTRYSTGYKTDDEIKELFTLPGKVKEYEEKLKTHDELSKSVEQYKKELEETKTTVMGDLLSKPLIKQAFVASQLQEKHPSLDKDVLAELAMSDLDNMDDLEVIAKERKMRSAKSSLENIKGVIKKRVGIDPEQSPEEWDAGAKTELELEASDARDRIKKLLEGVELPKFPTKEEREAQQAKLLKDKETAITPFKEIFKKFDEYQNGDFKFAVTDEYKAGLDDMFDGMFINGGLEVNEANLATAEKLKRAMFVDEYLPKMLEVKEKEVEARVKAEYDKLVHNDEPINTATATDQETTDNPDQPGLGRFFQDQREERITKF